MPWFVYMLECRDGSVYTGIAVDVQARYEAHVAGRGARYTKSHPPKKLLIALPCADRSEASKAEYAIKQFTPAQKRKYVRDGLALQRAGVAVPLPAV